MEPPPHVWFLMHIFYGCGVNIRKDFLGSLGVTTTTTPPKAEDLQDSGLILAVWILTVLPAPNIPNIQDLPIEPHVLVSISLFTLFTWSNCDSSTILAYFPKEEEWSS